LLIAPIGLIKSWQMRAPMVAARSVWFCGISGTFTDKRMIG
jgi:hypothetical protein